MRLSPRRRVSGKPLRLASPSLIACPNLVPSPSFVGALTGWCQCPQMARLQRQVLRIQPFVANRTFFRAAVRLHDRLFALAAVALCLAGYAADGMPSMPGPSRPLFSRPLRNFKIVFLGALPPGPPAYTLGRAWAGEYPCEGSADRSGLTPSAVRRNGWTALIYAALNDDRAIVAALLGARAAVDTQNIHGFGFAVGAVRRGGRRWPTVPPMRPCPPRPAG